jgi:hypothetical protein
MRDDVSRLVGIDGVVVTGVVEVARQLEIEVEMVAEWRVVGGAGDVR